MKHRPRSIVPITHPTIEKYAHEMSTGLSEDLQDLIRSSDKELAYIDMLSGQMVAQVLKMLIQISGAKRVLEIGSFTGFSALAMAEALPEEGEVVTIEMNLRYQNLSERHFSKYSHGYKIRLIKGNAREELDDLEGPFDLVFMDADKLGYPIYLEKCLPMMKSGGLIVVDNVLWDGTVIDPVDHKSQALDDFNKLVAKDDRVEQVLLPIRDGLTLIRKK